MICLAKWKTGKGKINSWFSCVTYLNSFVIIAITRENISAERDVLVGRVFHGEVLCAIFNSVSVLSGDGYRMGKFAAIAVAVPPRVS